MIYKPLPFGFCFYYVLQDEESDENVKTSCKLAEHKSRVPRLEESFVKAHSNEKTQNLDLKGVEEKELKSQTDENLKSPVDILVNDNNDKGNEKNISLEEKTEKEDNKNTSSTASKPIRLYVKQNFNGITVQPEFEGEDMQPLVKTSEDGQKGITDDDDDDDGDDDDNDDGDSDDNHYLDGEEREDDKVERFRNNFTFV